MDLNKQQLFWIDSMSQLRKIQVNYSTAKVLQIIIILIIILIMKIIANKNRNINQIIGSWITTMFLDVLLS